MLWNSKNRNYKIHRKIESKEHIARNLRHHTPGHEGGTEIDAKCCRKVQFHECLLLHQNRKHWSRNCEIRGPLGAHPVILKTPCVQGKKRFFLGTTLSKRENIFAYSTVVPGRKKGAEVSGGKNPCKPKKECAQRHLRCPNRVHLCTSVVSRSVVSYCQGRWSASYCEGWWSAIPHIKTIIYGTPSFERTFFCYAKTGKPHETSFIDMNNIKKNQRL